MSTTQYVNTKYLRPARSVYFSAFFCPTLLLNYLLCLRFCLVPRHPTMMMTNNRNQPAFPSVHHVDDAQNVEYAHRGGGRPSSPSDEAQDRDRGIQKIDEAMTMLTMTTGRGGASGGIPTELRIPSSSTASKENVRPNSSSGKKKYWHKKSNRDQPRENDVGPPPTTTTRMTADGGGGVRNSAAADEVTTKNVKVLHLKIKKPVVVEISSSHQPEKKTPAAARRILPSMDFQVAVAAPASIDEDVALNGCDYGDGGGDQEKKAPTMKKNKRKQWRNKKMLAARRGDASSGGGVDFSTNAGGASVLALLGQYPYVMPSMFDVYDGCTPHSCNQMTMAAGGGEGYHHDHQYDPSNFSNGGGALPPMPYTGHHHAYDDEHHPYSATVAHVIHPGAAIMTPGGYYVPATMMNDQTVYYNQPNVAAANEISAPYYHHHPCYSPYACGEAADPSSASARRRREGDDDFRGKSPLNINANEFMPMPAAFDPSKEENNSEA